MASRCLGWPGAGRASGAGAVGLSEADRNQGSGGQVGGGVGAVVEDAVVVGLADEVEDARHGALGGGDQLVEADLADAIAVGGGLAALVVGHDGGGDEGGARPGHPDEGPDDLAWITDGADDARVGVVGEDGREVARVAGRLVAEPDLAVDLGLGAHHRGVQALAIAAPEGAREIAQDALGADAQPAEGKRSHVVGWEGVGIAPGGVQLPPHVERRFHGEVDPRMGRQHHPHQGRPRSARADHEDRALRWVDGRNGRPPAAVA